MNINEAVKKYLDISTGHLPKREWDAFEKDDRVIVNAHEYGRFVCTAVAEDLQVEFPVLAKILREAAGLGCNWVNFDRDAGHIDGLEMFDW